MKKVYAARELQERKLLRKGLSAGSRFETAFTGFLCEAADTHNARSPKDATQPYCVDRE